MKWIVRVFVLILVASPLQAQTPSAAARYVSAAEGTTFDQLATIMFARNKELEATREQLRQAQARLTQAALRPNPSLDFSSTTDALFAREGEGSYSVAFNQPFELGGKRSRRTRVAEISVDLARAQIADHQRRLGAELHSLFVEALIAAARIEFFQQIQSVDQQMSRVMEVSLQAGDASRLDVALLRASVNRAVAQAVQAESQLSGFILQIKTLAGLGPEESLVLRRVADAGLPDLSRETALRLALENRPDLRAARLRESVNEAAIAVARAQATPDVVASVGYGKEKNAIEGFRPPQEKIIDRANLLSVGVSFSLPFFNRQQGNISEAISVQTQSRDQREAIEQQVRRDVLLAFERYDSARRAIDILTSGVISENQESFRIVRLSYDLGELRLIDLLNQQRVLIDTQISYLDVQRDSMLAAAELERALGTAVGGRR